MSSRHHLARHRAQPVRTNPMGAVSKAVSANAGTVGRQAAVIAAASGLILTGGLSANAAENTVGVSASVESATQTSLAVTAAPTATVSFDRPVITTVAAPVVEAVVPQSNDDEQEAAETATTAAPATATTATDAPAKAPDAPATTSAAASGLAAIAYTGIGNAYVWGGSTPAGWDCSGFTQWVYAQAGISIPRTGAWNAMTPTGTPQPGDLVMQNGGAHVGIYVGNGMMVSALNPSQGTLLHPVAATGSSSFFTLR